MSHMMISFLVGPGARLMNVIPELARFANIWASPVESSADESNALLITGCQTLGKMSKAATVQETSFPAALDP